MKENHAYGTIDIRNHRIGYAIVHPTCQEVMEYSSPTVRLAPHSPTPEVPNDIQAVYFIET